MQRTAMLVVGLFAAALALSACDDVPTDQAQTPEDPDQLQQQQQSDY